ncbi:MAG TPA: hypothetical protein VG965_00820 [Patescibacteria group bacterium]|nr:hypothetical protein [Patescibacteria group bacterium]
MNSASELGIRILGVIIMVLSAWCFINPQPFIDYKIKLDRSKGFNETPNQNAYYYFRIISTIFFLMGLYYLISGQVNMLKPM